MILRVYKKHNLDIEPVYLGEYLNLISIVRSDGDEGIVTDAMVYFIMDDGSVETANRKDVILKSDKNNNLIDVKPLTEDDIIEEIENSNFVDIE